MVGLASFLRRSSFPRKRWLSWSSLLVWHMSYVTAHEGCLASKGETIPALGSDVLPCASRFSRGPSAAWPWPRIGFLCCVPTRWHSLVTMSLVRSVLPVLAGHGAKLAARSVTHAAPYAVVVRGASLELSDAECLAGIEVSRPLNLARLNAQRTTVAPVPASGRAATTSSRNATWLILPVVICLSQRLSHACVSMN